MVFDSAGQFVPQKSGNFMRNEQFEERHLNTKKGIHFEDTLGSNIAKLLT